jgi:activator of HSP90 ATPase
MRILSTRLARFMPVPVLALVLTITACSDIQKIEIETVLDARNSAVSESNINAYSKLLIQSYQDQGQRKTDLVSKMLQLFEQFDALEMKTFGRTIRILDNNHAQCEQTYYLRAKADNKWREFNQREQISLTRTSAGWQISGGL